MPNDISIKDTLSTFISNNLSERVTLSRSQIRASFSVYSSRVGLRWTPNYTIACFTLSKASGLTPTDLASEIATTLQSSNLVAEAEVAGPYVNLALTKATAINEMKRIASPQTASSAPVATIDTMSLFPGEVAAKQELRTSRLVTNIFISLGYKTQNVVTITDQGDSFARFLLAKENVPQTPRKVRLKTNEIFSERENLTKESAVSASETVLRAWHESTTKPIFFALSSLSSLGYKELENLCNTHSAVFTKDPGSHIIYLTAVHVPLTDHEGHLTTDALKLLAAIHHIENTESLYVIHPKTPTELIKTLRQLFPDRCIVAPNSRAKSKRISTPEADENGLINQVLKYEEILQDTIKKSDIDILTGYVENLHDTIDATLDKDVVNHYQVFSQQSKKAFL